MLHVRKLMLKNFCQHKSLSLEFIDGVNLIVGPNGAGKSNLIRAIQFAFAGVLEKRTKQSAITIGHENQESFVGLEFDWQHRPFQVFRNLHNAGASLTSGDDVISDNASDLNLWLKEKLGISKDTIDYFIVNQGEIDEFLSRAGNGRLEVLLRYIPELPIFEKIWEVLGEKADGIEFHAVPELPMLPEDVEVHRQTKAEYESEIEGLKSSIPILESRLQTSIKKEDYDKYQQMISEYSEKITHLEEKIANLEIAITDLQKKKQDHSAYGSLADVNKNLQQVISSIAVMKAKEQEYLEAKKSVFELFSKRKPVRIMAPKDSTEIIQNLNYHQGILRHLKACNQQSCPFCGQNFDEVARKNRIITIQKVIDELTKKKEEIDAFNAKVAENEKTKEERTRLRENIRLLRRRKDGFGDYKELEGTQKELENVQTVLQNFEKEQADLTTKVTWAKCERDGCIRKIQELKEKLEGKEPLDSDQLLALRQRLQQEKELLATTTAKLIKISASLASYDQLLRHRMEIIRDNRIAERVKNRLQGIRAQFHRSVIPKIVLTNVFQRLISEVNNYLKIAGAPFFIEEINEDYDFVINLNGQRFVDKYLSGGQRIILTLMLRIAMLTRLFRDSRVLILDEPTVYLDESVREGLCEIFDSLRAVFCTQKLQLIMVTHDHKLSTIADHVISLSGV